MEKQSSQTRIKNILRFIMYILISLIVFMFALFISYIANLSLKSLGFSLVQADHLAGLIEGVIAAVAAALVLFQLRKNFEDNTRSNAIEEARFILQLNQSFIQDEKMTAIEKLLEQKAFYPEQLASPDECIITQENRQTFVNYLVYLEGLAPLILNDIISLDNIDDLMAYRYFLAVNNPDVQDKELIPFAEWYRGIYRVYKKWYDYRDKRGKEIVLSEYSLERRAPEFEFYAKEGQQSKASKSRKHA